jgi:hypothetical protein
VQENPLVLFRLPAEMTLPHKRLFLASAAGFSVSVLLAVLEGLRHRDIWTTLQLPGLFVGASIWSVHGGTSVEVVMVVVNGVIYSGLLLIAWGIVRLAHKNS